MKKCCRWYLLFWPPPKDINDGDVFMCGGCNQDWIYHGGSWTKKKEDDDGVEQRREEAEVRPQGKQGIDV